MIDMSKEEIIEKINYMINNWHRSVVEINIEWIKGLLDLYQKEKEKNKQLEDADLTAVYMNGFYDGEKKWKDKINGLLKEIDDNNTDEGWWYINKIEELLEERS